MNREFAFFKINTVCSIDLYKNSNITNSLSFTNSFIRMSFESFRKVLEQESVFNFSDIDLSLNEIEIIFSNTFKGSFKTISLENNIISSFQPDAFSYLPYLNEIIFNKLDRIL